MVVENLNNKILVQKKRKLATPVTIPEKCDPSEGGYSDESLIYNLCKKCNNDKGYYRVFDPDGSIYGNGKTDQFMEMAKALFNVLMIPQKKIFI